MAHASIRVSLTASLLVLVALLSLAILAVNVIAGRRISEDLSERYLEETERLVEEKLNGFFAPVVAGITNARHWSRQGAVDPHDVERSTAVYLPVLKSHPQISSLATGDERGYGYRIGAENDDFLVRINDAGTPGTPAKFTLVSRDGAVVRRYEKPDDYDPRKRPWFADAKRALEAAGSPAKTEVGWSEPFILNTSRLPGIAATLPFEDAKGGVYFATFNVMLTKLSDFTVALRPTPNGAAIVLTDAGEVIGFPAGEAWATKESRAALLKEKDGKMRMPGLAELRSRELTAAGGEFLLARRLGGRASARFEVDDAGWRVAFRPYALGGERRIWIGVTIPETDFLGEVMRQRRNILLVSAASLLAAAVVALVLARVYARPMAQLVEASDRMTLLDLTPGPPVRSHLLEAHRLAEAQERMRGALDSFARYVPTAVVRELLRRGEAARLGGMEQPITVMFSDIRNFTPMSERLTPDELSRHLGEYFGGVMAAIAGAGGVVDKMIGDAVMSLFGAPTPHADHAAQAVRGALACDRWLAEFEARCLREGRPPLVTHFGLSSGEAFVGNVGSADRLNYTALGDVVNLASRLEGVCKAYGVRILCSDAVRAAAGEAFVWRCVDRVAVRGKRAPVAIHEPLGAAGEVDADTVGFARGYEAALALHLERRFDDAIRRLDALGPRRASDASVVRLRLACERFRAAPPPADWDGVARMLEK